MDLLITILALLLVLKIFDDKENIISWWLYENVKKIIYFNNKSYDYDLTKIEDLYYYLTKQNKKIKKIEKQKQAIS